MRKRLFIAISSLIGLIIGGAVVWYVAYSGLVGETMDEASSSGTSSQEELVQTPETAATEPTQKPAEDRPAVKTEITATATAIPAATEEPMSTETQSTQVQPTQTEAQATVTQTAETQPTPTQTVEPQPTEPPTPEIEATATQPTQASPSKTPPAEVHPVVILQGQFKDADNVHKGSGTATIYQDPDGTYRLSFKDFAVCCGPDLYVFLANNPAPAGHADLGNYLELSSLQASRGDQEYEIPVDADLSQFKSVVIYCKPFQVIISTATFG